MLFDFFLEVNLKGFNLKSDIFSFKNIPQYYNVRGDELNYGWSSGRCCVMTRSAISNSYHSQEGRHYWLYGYAYSNNHLKKRVGRNPALLSVSEIVDLQYMYPSEWHRLIKGMYVFVTYDEGERCISATSDYLNMLPLYFASNSNGDVILSSSTHPMMNRHWVDRSPNPLAFGMQMLFDYSLGEEYYVKGIRRMENARTYTFNDVGYSVDIHWDVSSLKHDVLIGHNDSLLPLGSQLYDNVNLYAGYSDKFLLSFTGGFDGRTNLAVLDKPRDKFWAYSYGMPGSKQIRIPQAISEAIGIKYESILLNQEFLNDYTRCSQNATYFSNGIAPVGFGNIPYTFEKLRNYADVVVTGLCGSEVLRPLHNNQIQVNDQSFAIFMSDDLEEGIDKAIQLRSDFMPFDLELKTLKSDLYDFFELHYWKKYSEYDKISRFFFFIIQEGIRKYFSQEIGIERVFVTTKLPYFDMDFVESIYKTAWAGLYNGFLESARYKRRNGQILYTEIMKRYKPELLNYKLDRGYYPRDLLRLPPFNYFFLALGVFSARRYMQLHKGNDTFKTYIWANDYLKELSNKRYDRSEFIRLDRVNYELLQGDVRSSSRFLSYRHLASIKSFFEL